MLRSGIDALPHCDFCEEIHSRYCQFGRLYEGRLKSRQILATKTFVVMPTIGQLTSDHVLIVSRKHFTAARQLNEPQLAELDMLMGSLDAYYQRLPHEVASIAFEHGTPSSGQSGGCGISHLHVHMLPVPKHIDVFRSVAAEFEFRQIESLRDVADSVSEEQAYLFYRSQFGEKLVAPARGLPSQYLRREIARALGLANWNWRSCGLEDGLIRTVVQMRRAIGGVNSIAAEELVVSSVGALQPAV